MSRLKNKKGGSIEASIPETIAPIREPDSQPAETIAPAGETNGVIPETMRRPDQMSGVAPDRNVMLRAVIREVMGMRDLDGPQRTAFKGQIAAYALSEGPRLPRGLVAVLLEVTPTAISHYVQRIKTRMTDHWGFRLYVDEVTTRMKDRFALLS